MECYIKCCGKKANPKTTMFKMNGGVEPPAKVFKCDECGREVEVFVDDRKEKGIIRALENSLPEMRQQMEFLLEKITSLGEEVD